MVSIGMIAPYHTYMRRGNLFRFKFSFRLEQLNVGTHKIEGSKEHYYFNTLSSFKILPNLVDIPAITAEEFDVCGAIYFDKANLNQKADQREMVLKDEASGRKVTSTKTVADKFCFDRVPPGKYSVTAGLTSAEVSRKFQFSSPTVSVTVSSGPVLDVNFSASSVMVSGALECLTPSCGALPGLSVSLVPADSSRQPIKLANGMAAF